MRKVTRTLLGPSERRASIARRSPVVASWASWAAVKAAIWALRSASLANAKSWSRVIFSGFFAIAG